MSINEKSSIDESRQEVSDLERDLINIEIETNNFLDRLKAKGSNLWFAKINAANLFEQLQQLVKDLE